MTGTQAETWRKFRFITAPAWAYAFLLLLCTGVGLLLIFIIMRAVSRGATGYLPLTRAASMRIRNASIAGLSLFVLVLLLWIVGFVVARPDDSTANTISGIAFAGGLLVGLAAVAFWLLIRPRFGPGGKVLAVPKGQFDNLVVLDRVHPAFVEAVQHHQQMRAAQLVPPPPPSPLLPASK